MAGFADVGAPMFGLVVVGMAGLVVVLLAGAEVAGAEVAGALLEGTEVLAAAGGEVVVGRVAGGVAARAGLATESSEPVTTVTSAPPTGLPTPSTTVPASDDMTFSACFRCAGPS